MIVKLSASMLKVTILESGRRVSLNSPYTVTVDGKDITVPARFTTDFASVPRLIWWAFPPWGRYAPATVVHDYLYKTGVFSRKKADRIFDEIMRELNVKRWRRRSMYLGVRLFGRGPWKQRREEKAGGSKASE